MFRNELTEKMPCWDCRDMDRCLILESLLTALNTREGMAFRYNIKSLTFTCFRMVKVGT